MKTEKIIGNLLIIGAIGVFVPYTILTIIFNYPAVLREDAGSILTQFHKGGSTLIFVWLAFALLGLPLLEAYVLIGQKLAHKFYFVKWATTLGIISGIAQIIGLLRWVFVVPVLANDYVVTNNPATQEAIKIAFKLMHQFSGVLLGEHIGQLFTIAWTVMIASALQQLQLIPKWLAWFAYIASTIYLLAQTELLATVIPGFSVVPFAGFAGSTLWLIWLVMVGVKFRKIQIN